MQLDLLLVNPAIASQIYQALGDKLIALEPIPWLGMLAEYTRTKGFSVQILDAYAERLSPQEAALRAIDAKPRLTAVVVYGQNPSASTQVMPSAGAFCRALKGLAPTQKVLMVGGHVAALPRHTLEEEACDFVCTGEGFITLQELLEYLRIGSTRYSKVRGLMWKENGRIHQSPPAPNVTDLDHEVPGQAWDLLPMEKYRAHNWHCFPIGLDKRSPYASIYTTLGCPWHCNFCSIQAPFKSGESALGFPAHVNTYRRRSPHKTVEMIDTLVQNYGVTNIKIADEMFYIHRSHVEGICDLLLQRGYAKDLNIWAYARIDTVRDPHLLDKLRKAGWRWLAFGIESGNEAMRKGMDKGFSQEQVFQVLSQVQDAGIHIGANYIFGMPEDDLSTMQETLDLALSLNTEWANFYCTMSLPGSALYQQALAEGWPLPKTWSAYSQHSTDTLPLPTRHLTGAEVLKFRDQAFNTYFTNPSYLSMVERKFGVAIREHIQQMTSFKLLRNWGEEGGKKG